LLEKNHARSLVISNAASEISGHSNVIKRPKVEPVASHKHVSQIWMANHWPKTAAQDDHLFNPIKWDFIPI